MSNLINHAKTELEMAGLFDSEKDFYGGHTGKAVLELIECFSNQGHSGMSASIVIDLFSRLADFKPINPITGAEEEWCDLGDGKYQNKRCFSVFKEDGNSPYYLDAIVWRESDGSCFTGTVQDITSRQFIKLPFFPKTFYIDINDNREIINMEKLEDVFEYYDKN